MRRSAKVTAPLLASVALSMATGCRKPEMQRCVDENNRVVDDTLCANLPAANNQQYQNLGGPGYIPYHPLYHFYYGGWGGYGLGTVVGGGSYAPSGGRSYVTRFGATTRGGFGGSMSSGHGGGE
ncbi:hypothetical protein [Edaphobacter modestus]|uniref:Lipoprotein n=1 Tax=Edaphobacter modestus TaxID=388466 RepID=A0A4Q7YV01_9BACT|nr:hypothetical protein [Edaphobacter modestus]RZU41458.1 hypothetical protein BDD14_2981 [Edaphobacter modestus]